MQRKFEPVPKITKKADDCEESDDVIAVKGGSQEPEEDESLGRYVNLEVHFRNSYKIMTCGRRWTPLEIIQNVSKQMNVP